MLSIALHIYAENIFLNLFLFFTLMLTNASIFSVCVYLRFKNMYFLIGLISGFAAVINFFGIVLPCCCLKLSNLYDDPEFERLSKLRVK